MPVVAGAAQMIRAPAGAETIAADAATDAATFSSLTEH
jgi:hypothetical protein